MGVLPVCYVSAPMDEMPKDQKKGLDPLELRLQTVVSLHVGARN